MAVRYQMNLRGLEDYLEAVQAAGADIDQAVDRALVAGASVILGKMKEFCPKDTGNLEANLQMTQPAQDGNLHYIDIGLLKPDARTARYGLVQEYGSTTNHAQPYIRRAFDEGKTAARAAQRNSLKADGKI